ncbi:MAG: putative DNA-binding domain-containing protein [Hydrogenophaga sp.]|uniref:HvfC/BufC N-terminal domain-containing protein n=1 Tax=Hydrogenophaga sp. TaxID=1904254 RepID=UPI001D311DF0|nr:DNA-binding domain-containing protein [Hydrogenophaga sp.]MBX3610786.1 putative DNA-binding domain-containing protein [Hydrogenophaga sp.]
MSTLADAQRALLDALLQPRAPTHGWEPVGLGVYRANAHAHAERTLEATYPVVRALLGDESFHALARALWHHHPPVSGDLGDWGGALADFADAQQDLATLPYLADVARIEWAIYRAMRAPATAPDPESFALLQQHAPEQLRAVLAPGTTLIQSPWPALSVVDAHLHGDPDFDTVGQRLRDGVSEAVRVWRPDAQVRAAVIDADTARFEALLAAGASLGLAMDAAPIDVHAWLHASVQQHRLLGLRAVPTHTPNGDPT